MATIHNPTNFEPRDYEVTNYLDNRRPVYCGGLTDFYAEEVKAWEDEMLRTFGADWHKKVHHCIHCGNGSVRWITAVKHLPTNETVVFGAICTNRLGFADKFAFKLAQLQAKAAARKIKFTIFNDRAKFLVANPLIAEALTVIDRPEHSKNSFVKDVLSKLDTYGSLSDRQVAAVISSLARDRAYAAKKVVEAAEVKGEAPTGRVTVTGLVVSMKDVEGHYGITTKMMLKLDNNSRVWLTAPFKETIERGDTVTVAATFTVSKDDTSFAFGARPHLVSRVAKAIELT